MRGSIAYLKIATMALVSVFSSLAATPVASLYIESYAGLQRQLFKGAELFNSPELGAVPMMLTMTLPGAAHMNTAQSVAIHCFSTETDDFGVVIEVSAAETPAAYLEAVLGRAPDSIDGIHRFNGGAARVHDGRIQISPSADDLATLAQDAGIRFPAMPDVPGVLRLVIMPPAARTRLDKLRDLVRDLLPLATQAGDQKANAGAIDFLADITGQIATVQLGINVSDDGLELHSRLAAVPGSEMAAYLASQTPVPDKLMASCNANDLFWLAAGGRTLPPVMAEKFAALHKNRLEAQYRLAAPDAGAPADFSGIVNLAIRSKCAPFSLSATIAASALQASGTMLMDNAADFLAQCLGAIKTAPMNVLLADAGMAIEETAPRTYKNTAIHRHIPVFDTEKFVQNQKKHAPAQKKALKEIEKLSALLKNLWNFVETGGECAAAGGALVFGTGTPQMIEQELDRLGAAEAASAEAGRILARLAPENPPVNTGRIAASAIICAVAGNLNHVDKKTVANMAKIKGEAIIFTQWLTKGEERSLILVPAAEIKALRSLVQLEIAAAEDDAQEDGQREAETGGVTTAPQPVESEPAATDDKAHDESPAPAAEQPAAEQAPAVTPAAPAGAAVTE